MPRPILAYINQAALAHNLSITRRYAPHARITAVIKANAYGHGLMQTADALKSTDGFALLELEAAINLRDAGYNNLPILLLEGFFSTHELALFEKYRLSTVIHHEEQIEMLANCKQRGLNVFLKINTGMNRLGFEPKCLPTLLERLSANPAIAGITVMSHFATADEVSHNNNFMRQLQLFDKTTRINPKLPHSLANSAAIIRYPETHRDWVRPGLMLYGASPFSDQSATEIGLIPAMMLTSKIIAIQHLKQGDQVGYGCNFQADKPMRIGIVACGYADGYPRHAPTGTPVLINNQRCRLVGRVSMDMLTVDITEATDVQLNNPVILWGKGLPVEEIAHYAGTVSYELLCAVSTRVKLVVEQVPAE
ncbi:MAG: alanine racemase [Nitrosomonas sp.]|nr:alanine racemase [Nitrosomonas sp.]